MALTGRGGGGLEGERAAVPRPLGRTGARRRLRRVLGVNLLLSFVGVSAVGVAGEAWLRRSLPFAANRLPLRFVPGAGLLLEPHGEVRHTNLFDYWTISRANRLGFLDREPISPRRAAAGCHLALVGDSMLEAREVVMADKAQVRLEALAARERPDLDLTVSAFGLTATAQVQQIPIYDAFVRPLRPKVVVLQATPNDYMGNSGVLTGISTVPPLADSYARADRGPDGRIGLRRPDGASPAVREQLRAARRRETGLRRASFLWSRLERDRIARRFRESREGWRARQRWRRLSGETESLSGWRPPGVRLYGDSVKYGLLNARRAEGEPAPAYAEALELTAFALDEFAARAARDGSRLVLFLSQYFGAARETAMKDLAEERGIPVVDLYRHIGEAKGNWHDASFRRDSHWHPRGHRWAAEALWEYLKELPSPCAPAEVGDSS